MRINYPAYHAESSDANYPFEANISRSNGDITIENDIFVDARFYPPDGRHDIFISEIVVADEMKITISSGTGAVGFSTFKRSAPPHYIRFISTDDDDEQVYVGQLISLVTEPQPTTSNTMKSTLYKLAGWPAGKYTFTMNQTRFAAMCVVPQPQKCVRAIQLASGALFHGDVTLVGENGVQLTMYPFTPVLSSSSSNTITDIDRIRVDVVGDPLFKRRECDDNGLGITDLGRILQAFQLGTDTIEPYNGDFSLTVGAASGEQPALRIIPEQNALRFEYIDK